MAKRSISRTKSRLAASKLNQGATHGKTGRKRINLTESVAHFRKAHWSVYQNLQKKADKAWAKLRWDVGRKASPDILMKDRNNLLLLLGECNYMAGECLRTGLKRS